jgi:hypothetical protein
MTNDIEQLESQLSRWERRLRLDDGLRLAVRSLWLAALAALFLELAARYWPIADRHLWALVPLEIWLLGVGLYSLLRPLSLWQVAHRLDGELGLKDRLATALELHRREMKDWKIGRQDSPPTPHPSNPPAIQPNFLTLQLTDALAVARQITPDQLLRRIPRQPLWLAGGLLALTLTLAFLPNPMDAILTQRAAIQKAAEEQAQTIEEARQEFARTTDPTSEDRAKALQALAELMKELAANPGDLEQALADIAAAEARLQELQNPQAAARQTAAEQIASQLTALSRGEAQASTELSEAATALTELATALGTMDETGQAELAGALEAAAAEAAVTDAELAEALQEMAQAARAGDMPRAIKAAGQCQGALARAGQSANLQNALAAAQASLAQSRQQLARQGMLAQAQGGSQGRGQGRGQQVGSGGGSMANQLPAANRQGAAGNPTQPNRPPGVSESETVYAPLDGLHLTGETGFVAGQESEAGQVVIREEKSPQPGAAGSALIPYRQVYQDYAAAAAETMDRERIPPEMQDYVRDYFSQLAPE